ncbi:EAL domain-containing protein [Enterobacter hormaechei]|uniref:EAL domain-containing protein n=3 Tax=Enterobacter hormaechei TaxID=158836 RepID=UPI00388E31AC
MGEISVKTGNNARNGGKNSLNRLIRCVCGKKIGPDPRNFNQRVSLGRNDLLIRTFLRQTFESMPFIKLELSEHFPGLDKGLKSPLLKSLSQGVNGLWLDDLGAGNANVVSLMEGYFEVVKVDRCFFNEQVQKPTFNQLIASIKKHCDKIIIEGIENRDHMGLLREVGIWGLQGYLFKSVPFKNVDLLL